MISLAMPRYRFLSRDEVRLHSEEDDCWIIVGEDVFDLTPFLLQTDKGREFANRHGGKELTVDELPQCLQSQRVISKYMLGKLDSANQSSSSPQVLLGRSSDVASGVFARWRDILAEKEREISLLQTALAVSERRYRELQSEVGELMENLEDVTANIMDQVQPVNKLIS